MPEQNASSPIMSQGDCAPMTATRTPPTGNSVSLCELCSRSLVLDDSCIGATCSTSSNGAISTLSFPKGENPYLLKGIDFRRTVTNPDLPELSTSVKEKCRFCAALKKALLDRYENRTWWRSPQLKISIEIQYQWSREWGEEVGENEESLSLYSLFVIVTHPENPDLETPYGNWFLFRVLANKGECRDWLQIKGDPLDPEGPMSEGNIGLVSRWFNECATDLKCGLARNDENFVPKRLLDVGLVGETNPPVLIETTESPPNPTAGEDNIRYACLSYCWGAGPLPLRTTSQTIAKHKEGIPVDKVPQVFSDAIFVTRKLGLRYLWIDALCIIQDSAADWEEESGKMTNIYQHSFVTFGAATSSSCHETFLRQREDDSIHLDFRSSLNPGISGHYSIFLHPEYAGIPIHADLCGSVWNTRGWVWQEQNMPQRLLIFGSKVLHFQCHHRTLSELGGCLFDGHDEPPTDPPKVRTWRSWMEDYSGRKFTHACDKLAAASGFAKSVNNFVNSVVKPPTYVAGIWLDYHFHSSFRWVVARSHLSFREMIEWLENKENYCAPSWSWASRDQAIRMDGFDRYNEDEDFEVIRHNLIPAKSDATIKIKPGSSITVRGKIIRMRQTFPDVNIRRQRKDGEKDTWMTIESHGSISCHSDWDPQLGYDGDSENLLHLFVTSANGEFAPQLPDMYLDSSAGVVLYPIGLESGMQFLRVGTFKLKDVSASSWPIHEVTIF